MPVIAPVAVYRFFDSTGQLLYVGMTESPAGRWRSHAATKLWWQDVADAQIEWHSTREDAARAEAAAIRDEAPRYNVAGVDLPTQMPRAEASEGLPAALAEVSMTALLAHAAQEACNAADDDLNDAMKAAVDAGGSIDQITEAYGNHFYLSSPLTSLRTWTKERDRGALAAAKRTR